MRAHNPSHPGKILMEMYIKPLGLTVTEVAAGINVTRKALSELLNQKSGVSYVMAIRLARAFGTTAKIWLNLQQEYDLAKAEKDFKEQNIKIFFQAPKGKRVA